MTRRLVGAFLVVLSFAGTVSAQLVNRNGVNTFGGTTGLGNAGGFATGPGFANGSTNSNNFGSPFMNRGNSFSAAIGMPSAGNYAGALPGNLNAGMPGIGTGANMGMNGMGMNGFVPGIAPPGFTQDMFGNNVGVGDGSGYTNFGNAMTYSALGLGFGGPGFGGPGFGGLGYNGLGVSPLGYAMGYSYPGMVPGSFIPGVGYVSPADFAAAAGMNPAVNAEQVAAPAQPRNLKTTAGATLADDDNSARAAGAARGSAPDTRPRAGRRSFLNDNVPLATANAIRIQNRLHNVKNPNLTNIKVLISSRTAVLSGSVDSKEDEKLALRMVALEPGVVDVKSELLLNNAKAE